MESTVNPIAKNRFIKIKLIREIGELLLKYGREPLDERDFDILYDLDIDELINTKFEIERTAKKEK